MQHRISVIAPFDPDKAYQVCPVCGAAKAVSHYGVFEYCHNCGHGRKDCGAHMPDVGPVETITRVVKSDRVFFRTGGI
tara:strand:- start:245 stop:478 length:234 start_codon:yes stop_codon:yes gene_type:complete